MASCGVNAAVRRGPKSHLGVGSMYEHCRAPKFPVEDFSWRKLHLRKAWTCAEVYHKNSAFGKGLAWGLTLLAGEPGPNAKAEQGQGDHGERKRW